MWGLWTCSQKLKNSAWLSVFCLHLHAWSLKPTKRSWSRQPVGEAPWSSASCLCSLPAETPHLKQANLPSGSIVEALSAAHRSIQPRLTSPRLSLTIESTLISQSGDQGESFCVSLPLGRQEVIVTCFLDIKMPLKTV